VLQVDPREGSKKLVDPLRSRGLSVEVSQMEAGDVAWVGRGEGGKPVLVGVEYKTISDLLQCFENGRFAENQLPGLQDNYDIAWLLVEGQWREGEAGELRVLTKGYQWEEPRGRLMSYVQFEERIASVEILGGVAVVQTRDFKHTLAWLHARYSWWTSKNMDEHKSHLQLYDNKPMSHRVTNRRPNLAVKIASQLPGIGWEGAWALEKEKYLGWKPEQWADLRVGKRQSRLGEKRGTEIWESLSPLF
jgi:ERCC4-type nuclease